MKQTAALLALGLLLWFGMGMAEFRTAAHGLARTLRLVAGGVALYFGVLFALGFRLRDFSRRAAR